MHAFDKKHLTDKTRPELFLERERYRPAQAKELGEDTRRLIERGRARAARTTVA